MIVVLNVLTLLIYDPLYYTDKDGSNGPPQWMYFTCAFLPVTTLGCAHFDAGGPLDSSCTRVLMLWMGEWCYLSDESILRHPRI